MNDGSGLNLARQWGEIIRRGTLEDFATAFSPDAILEASVAFEPIRGAEAIRAFFGATRSMYDSIAFTREAAEAGRTYLEWQGRAFGEDVAGITILARNAQGEIESIQLFHRPFQMVRKCSAYLAQRLAGQLPPGVFAVD